MGIRKQAAIFGEHVENATKKRGIEGQIARVTRGARYLSLHVRLDDERDLDKALKLGDNLAYEAGAATVVVTRQGGLILYQFQLRQGYWRTYTRADLERSPGTVGVGFTDGTQQMRQVNLDFDPPHVLVAGTSGSGKTETTKSMLVGLMQAYQPQSELQVLICDPNNDYHHWFNNSSHLAHPIARSEEEVYGALMVANGVLRHRRLANARDDARLVVLVEEAETTLRDRKLMEMARTIAKGGRAFRVNLLLTSQKPTQRTLPDLLSEILNRWVGRLEDAKVSALVTGQPGIGAHRLSMKGDFLHVGSTQTERLQVAMATQADFDALPRGNTPDRPASADAEEDIQVYEDEEEEIFPDEETTPGRPRKDLEGRIAARYLVAYMDRKADQVTQSQARALLNLSKGMHLRYKNFAQEQGEEIKRLLRR